MTTPRVRSSNRRKEKLHPALSVVTRPRRPRTSACPVSFAQNLWKLLLPVKLLLGGSCYSLNLPAESWFLKWKWKSAKTGTFSRNKLWFPLKQKKSKFKFPQSFFLSIVMFSSIHRRHFNLSGLVCIGEWARNQSNKSSVRSQRALLKIYSWILYL